MKPNNKNTGFTLIELMIMVTIIGILAGIAIPTYQTYVVRTKLIELSHFSAAAKIFIWEEYFTGASMPPTSSNAADHVEQMMLSSTIIGLATYNQIDRDNSSLEVTFQNLGLDADNTTIVFLFETDLTKIELDCRGGTLPTVYRPPICRL